VAEGKTPTTLPFDAATMAHPPSPSRSSVDPLIASLMPYVVKIYGGRIGGQRGYASGVIVAPEGDIVAPLALLLEASDLRIMTADGQVHFVRVKYRDDRRQLALLEIRDLDQAGRPAEQSSSAHKGLIVDASNRPAVGDGVYVVGNPFKIAEGDEPCSVDQGIISGRVRLDARRPGGGSDVAYRGEVLILDAMASNTGSPGGGVFDMRGRLIGVVGEVIESRGTNTLLNYAFPADEIASFLRDAATTTTKPSSSARSADAGPGYHGIKLSRFGYRQKLPFVESVAKDSPAARADVRAGDLIISANSRPVPRSAAFTEICEALRAGETMSLVLKRGEALVSADITLEEAPK
jgi:S1-C subfamily serine protease